MRAVLVLCLAACVAAALNNVGYQVMAATGYTQVASSNMSTLYTVEGNFGYDWPIYLVDLWGTHYQMGYDYGMLVGKDMVTCYNIFIGNFLKNVTIEIDAVELFLDWQWNDYLSLGAPVDFMEELDGIGDAGVTQGIKNLQVYATRIIVLANLPGTFSDIQYILEGELLHKHMTPEKRAIATRMMQLINNPAVRWNPFHCSMWAAWGTRTIDGQLRSARNLDWFPDTGAAQYKLITVYHPNNSTAHTTLGFVGFIGALAGMSADGLTVHEANLEEGKEITFFGTPWVLRLRYVMQYASNIAEAKALWEATNNTVGFNHMIGSQNDVAAGHAAMVLETMKGYTAYFLDNDPREQDATYTCANGTVAQLGFPMTEAVYRTNAGFDPTIRKYYSWGQGPNSDSEKRYLLIRNGIIEYESLNIPLADAEAINITSIVASKDNDAPQGDPYKCATGGTPNGTNVVSVVFNPSEGTLFAAWDNGHKSTWRAACCNTYVQIDINSWFNGTAVSRA